MRIGSTHEVSVHSIMDFLDPVSQIYLLLLHLSRELGMGDGPQDAKHARCCPSVS